MPEGAPGLRADVSHGANSDQNVVIEEVYNLSATVSLLLSQISRYMDKVTPD
jgi:hypothetical protein